VLRWSGIRAGGTVTSRVKVYKHNRGKVPALQHPCRYVCSLLERRFEEKSKAFPSGAKAPRFVGSGTQA